MFVRGRVSIIDAIEKQKLTFDEKIPLSEEVKSLISSMLIIDIDQRLSFEDFFGNDWVQGGRVSIEEGS